MSGSITLTLPRADAERLLYLLEEALYRLSVDGWSDGLQGGDAGQEEHLALVSDAATWAEGFRDHLATALAGGAP